MTPNPDFWKQLIASGRIERREVESVFREVAGDPFEGLSMLVKERPSDKDWLCRIWGDALGVAAVDLDTSLFAPDLVERLPKELALQACAIPLYEFGGTVTVACADPADRESIAPIAQKLHQNVSPVFAWPDDIRASIEIHYQNESEVQEIVRRILDRTLQQESRSVTFEQLQQAAGDQAVVEFVQGVLLLAAKRRASDVHFEPGEARVRIRYRIDGVLHEVMSVAPRVHLAVASRLKILANLDIVEKRKPQDGRLSLELPGRTLDFRFSSVPSIYGEKIVLRILGSLQKVAIPSIGDLSLSSVQKRGLERVLKHPNGVFLLTFQSLRWDGMKKVLRGLTTLEEVDRVVLED